MAPVEPSAPGVALCLNIFQLQDLTFRVKVWYDPAMRIPKEAKLEKVVSKDAKHPILHHPFLRVTGKGADREGTIVVSDGIGVVVMPVKVADNDTPGPVHIESIKAARKIDNEVECVPGYNIVPGGVAYPREDDKYSEFPAVDSLLVENADCVYEIALNAKMLYALAQSMGTDVVKLRVQADPDNLPIGVEPHPSEPHVHGSRAAMMPYRLPNSI